MATYEAGTILVRKEPQGDSLDRLRVVGPSPITHSGIEEWSGSGFGEAFVVTPADEFASNEVLPLAAAQKHYKVESTPDPTEVRPITAEDYRVTVRQPGRLPTPEDVFRQSANKRQEQPTPPSEDQVEAATQPKRQGRPRGRS